MAEDKTNAGSKEPVRAEAGDPSEVEQFAKQHGLSIPEAREIIDDAAPGHNQAARAVPKP